MGERTERLRAEQGTCLGCGGPVPPGLRAVGLCQKCAAATAGKGPAGSRARRRQEAQEQVEHGQRGMTRADEGRVLGRAPVGAITWIIIAFACLCLVGAFSGGGMELLGGAVFWGLLALLNEHLRARGRARRGE